MARIVYAGILLWVVLMSLFNTHLIKELQEWHITNAERDIAILDYNDKVLEHNMKLLR